ncbi:MAG: FecR domain-containing protein [Elusimicrobia bacterium]|nr:FecR domain-containing protein [Elusimicrobiota bacterium]
MIRLAVVYGLLAASPGIPAEAGEATRLTEFSGVVQVKSPSDFQWMQVAKVPMDLAPGVGVRTGVRGKATVVFEDGTRVELSANASFAVEEAGARGVGVRLFMGVLRAKVERLLSRRFSVRTPTAVCSVRGTEFQVQVSEGGRTNVDLYKGLLAVEDQRGQQILLKAGQRLEVDGRGIGRPTQAPGQSGARSGGFHGVMRRELSLEMSKEEVQAAAAREIKLAEYQQGKALTDVFGNRVRVEEYVMRPQNDQFKFVVLNERQDRFDYFYYLGTFNKDLPRDLSVALRQMSGGADTAPEYYLKAFETGRSNTKDSMVEVAQGGHQVDVNNNLSASDNVASLYNPATDDFEDVSGRSVYQTIFDDYGFYINGNLKYGWSGTDIDNYDAATAATVSDPITGAALAGALPNRTVSSVWPEADKLHQEIYESYSDGTFTKWDNYIMGDDGKVASFADFNGVRSGSDYKDRLLRFNYEQVITATEFEGRKIDIVVEPKILIQSGLIQ